MLRIFIVALFYLLHVTSGEDVLGDIVVKNPKDPKYYKLADESMKKYLNDAHIKVAYYVLYVDHATEQVVNGLLTRIDFTISNMYDRSLSILDCYSEILETPRAGVNIIKVHCHQNTDGNDLPGGIVDKNPKDPKYKKLAEESMEKYLKDTHITDPYKVLSVDHASEQVVSGLLTRIDFAITRSMPGWVGPALQCHSEILERPWLGPNDIKVQCTEHINVVRTEQHDLPGGIIDMDPEDPKFKELAEESMEKYLKDMQIAVPHKVLSVDYASEQIVSGLLTRIDFEIVPNLLGWTGTPKQCHSEIFEKPWEKFKNINVRCTVLRHSFQALGEF